MFHFLIRILLVRFAHLNGVSVPLNLFKPPSGRLEKQVSFASKPSNPIINPNSEIVSYRVYYNQPDLGLLCKVLLFIIKLLTTKGKILPNY